MCAGIHLGSVTPVGLGSTGDQHEPTWSSGYYVTDPGILPVSRET